MDTNAVIVIVLAIAVIGTECTSPPEGPRPVRPNPHDSCSRKLEECTGNLQQSTLPLIKSRELDYRGVINNIDSLCEDYQEAANCIRPSLYLCPHGFIRRHVDMALSVGDYLCSAEGKSLLREFKESVCFENPAILTEGQEVLVTCYVQDSNPVPPGMRNEDCTTILNTQRCVEDLLRERCGNAAEELHSNLMSRVAPIVSGQDCWNNEASETLKRAFSLFKRSLFTDQ